MSKRINILNIFTNCVMALLLLSGVLYACSSNKKYPCPAYEKPRAQFDSTGNMTGGYKVRKDAKSGLIKKKKNTKLMDRRKAG